MRGGELRQQALDDTVLRAPFDGTVVRKIARNHGTVHATQGIVLLRTH